jgi:hypothetical protein
LYSEILHSEFLFEIERKEKEEEINFKMLGVHLYLEKADTQVDEPHVAVRVKRHENVV